MENPRPTVHQFGKIWVTLVNSNIADLEADVLVNAANNRLMMGGGVAAALRSRGGIGIHQEAIKHAPAKIGSVVVTGAGNLKAKFVYHAVVIDYDVSIGTDMPSVREAIRNLILQAGQDEVASMALPLFGAGAGGLGIDRSLETILDSLEEFSGLLTNI